MTDKYVSPPLKKPLRDLCPVCKERPAKQETEVCQSCEDDAQANVVDLDERRDFAKWGG